MRASTLVISNWFHEEAAGVYGIQFFDPDGQAARRPADRFLGSGKTSLLNRLLAAPQFADTAVVVNEFGEIGLDHVLVQAATDNVVLLEAGCLCCTIADSLPETLADLHYRRARGELPPFARVVIETQASLTRRRSSTRCSGTGWSPSGTGSTR